MMHPLKMFLLKGVVKSLEVNVTRVTFQIIYHFINN